ncbi:YHS domain protein [Nonomuraea sp. NPDC048916]|uniref:YHS domain protein n=1 Tax=Nonomuraea sp. NPDC048916 TaxID=3154232 RepID=UPI0033E9603D
MIFVELFVPRGSLDADRLRRVAERLGSLYELAEGEHMQAGTADVFRSLFQVVVHEPEVWVAGERPVTTPRYVVRAHVPGPWRKDMSGPIISYVTRVLRQEDGREPVVHVHVLGVPEGGIGLDGRATTSTGIVDLLNEPYKAELASGRAVRDPLCGMIVLLDDTAITLEVDGTRHGFCCEECRDAFAERRRKEAARA